MSDRDPRFREICRTYPDDVLLRRPHEIFQPPAAAAPPAATPRPTGGTYTFRAPVRVVSSTTPDSAFHSIENAEPVTPGSEEPRRPTLCERCRQELGDSDVISLEAPEAYILKHIDDDAPLLKCWHKRCFEQVFKIALPEFIDNTPPEIVESRSIARRIIIKDDRDRGDKDAVSQ